MFMAMQLDMLCKDARDRVAGAAVNIVTSSSVFSIAGLQ
jgi:hypothetical protein